MDTPRMVTAERFAEGLTPGEFVGSMRDNKEVFQDNYERFLLDPDEEAFARTFEETLKILVLAEDWCADVLRYVPALVRMAEAAPDWQVRIFLRDRNPDLAGIWLKDGEHRAIPVMVFFDEEMNELTHFIERPLAVYAEETRARWEFVQQHPELEDASHPTEEMSLHTMNIYSDYLRRFRAAHQKEWQHLFIREIKSRLQSA